MASWLPLVLLEGCQAIHPHAQPANLDEEGFKNLWTLHQHCLASSDPETSRLDAVRLSRALPSDGHVSTGLATPFDQFVSKPPLRLSVDPTALAVACALHAGHVALMAGQYEPADELFRSIIHGYPQADYAYYVSQARAGRSMLRADLLLRSTLRLASAP